MRYGCFITAYVNVLYILNTFFSSFLSYAGFRVKRYLFMPGELFTCQPADKFIVVTFGLLTIGLS